MTYGEMGNNTRIQYERVDRMELESQQHRFYIVEVVEELQ